LVFSGVLRAATFSGIFTTNAPFLVILSVG